MIEKAIEYRQTLTRVQLIAVLMSLYKEEKYALKKSVGSIGGAVSQEFLYYSQKNDSYTRIKWNFVIERGAMKIRGTILERFTFINSILSKSQKLISYYPSLLVASVLRQPQANTKEQQCFRQSDKSNRRIRLGAHGYRRFQNNHKRMHQQKRQPRICKGHTT